MRDAWQAEQDLSSVKQDPEISQQENCRDGNASLLAALWGPRGL
jgi:hypothetical protein